jgi:DNA-binding transcriptional ArsR family regulator
MGFEQGGSFMPRTEKRERRPRPREDAASYAVGHRIRIEILAVLHEGPASINGLVRELRQTRGTITHHLEELLLDHSIEVAYSEERRNFTEHWYCMVKLPEYSSDEIAEMGDEAKQALFSLIIQSTAAEAFAALWAGKMLEDEEMTLAWDRIDLDEQGRRDLAQEQDRSWQRIHEIAAEAANRVVGTQEEPVRYTVASMGFKRFRTNAPAVGRAAEDLERLGISPRPAGRTEKP